MGGLMPSIMVLVKNEEYWLPYVLKQCEGVFDSYVIYDIGSTDNTRNIIDWFVERNKNQSDIVVRKFPHLEPEVQGTFRNSMIPEGRRDIYMILDGDELYTPKDLAVIPRAASELWIAHNADSRFKFGVFKRVEVNETLTKQYDKHRSHHRLYTRDAYWKGTHPGEESGYKQNEQSEKWFEITCWHMHNAIRSPKEDEATKRIIRKSKASYHPGKLIELNLLKELPVLRNRIENFTVSPALESLWKRI